MSRSGSTRCSALSRRHINDLTLERTALLERSERVPRSRGTTDVISDHADVLCFLALLTGHRVELNELALFEALVTVALDVGEMYEDVVTLLARDEAESLFCIEKLHCTLCHDHSILNTANRLVRIARWYQPYSACRESS